MNRQLLLSFIAGLVMMSGLVGNQVWASLLVQNFSENEVVVSPGMEILKYEVETMDMLDSKAEFDSEIYSNGQFEVGIDDLESVAAADDYVTLNHYGDNPPDTSVVDWWDDDSDSSTKYNWRYRRCFTVDHTAVGASSQTEYQLLLRFDTAAEVAAGQMDIDGDDIRFVDEDDNELDYFISKDMNTADTHIWVQMDNIDAATTEEVCMYYGDVSGVAPAQSDRDATFDYPSPVGLYYSLWQNSTGANANIASYVGSNDVTYGAFSNTFAQYGVSSGVTIPGQATPISAEGPLSISFTNNGTDVAAPIAYAGTSFVHYARRGTDNFNIVAPFGTANVTIQESVAGVFTNACGAASNFSVTGGTAFNQTCDITNNVAYTVTSDVPILVGHWSTNNRDTTIMYPADKTLQEDNGKYEIYGVGSNSMILASNTTCNNVDIHRSNGTSTTVNLNAANNYAVRITGGTSQGRGDSYLVSADCPIGASSNADGDGGEEAVFVPDHEFSDVYLLPEDSQYVTGAAESLAVSCDIYNTGGLINDSDTSTGGDGINQPSEIYFPSSNVATNVINFNAGFRMECPEPVFSYFEKGTQDETNFLSHIQARKMTDVEPVVDDLDNVDEQGLYYESGFGGGNVMSLDPILWLDASDINGDGTSPADATAIDDWYDKSSQENHALDVSGAGVPVKITELGRDAVEFSSDLLQTQNDLFPNLPETDVTYFMVSRTRSVTNGFAFVTEPGNVQRFGTHVPWGDNNWYSDFDCCGDGRIVTAWGGNTVDYFLWSGRHSSTTGKELRRDGASLLTSGVNTTGSNAALPLTIGGAPTDTTHQQINISELIVFDRDLSSEEVENVERYLRDKWSVATGGLSIDNKAYLEWIIDRSADTYGDHTFWDKIQWEEVVSDRTSENAMDGVIVEVASSDAAPSCAVATYTETVLYETELNSSVNTAPTFSDERTAEKYIKIVDSMSDAPCLRVRVYLQTGDEAYAPRVNNVSVKYRVPTLLEDQLNSPAVSIPGNDGSLYGDDRVRVLKVMTTNTGLDNSVCELGYNGVSNAGAFSNADFEYVELSDSDEVLQFDFPAFPAVPPEVFSGNSVLCDDSEDVALYFEHQRSGVATESFNLSVKQDIQNFSGPFSVREFVLNVAGV